MTNSFKVVQNSNEPQLIGILDIEKIQMLTGILLPVREVYIYPGAIRHIKKRHPGVWEKYGHTLSSVIQNPDYVGSKEDNSVELYKQIGEHILLAIKLDPSGYLFISTLFEIQNATIKIKKRLSSGRIVPYV
jgi:hypothetical protein